MMQKHTLAKALRAIATALDNLDQEEVEQLISGKGRFTLNLSDKPKMNNRISSNDTEEVWQKLNECNDRDEARQILSTIVNRNTLASLAKNLKIHVTKHDKREDIENKLIESVIGGKLRTEAIQTLNLGGGNQ